MKTWDLFLPQVAPETYGALHIMQIEAVRNAAIEFCEKTRTWQEQQAPYPLPTIVAGASPFLDFQFDTGQLVYEILAAGLCNTNSNISTEVTPRTAQWADERYPGWQSGAHVGTPSNVVQISSDQFAPLPAANGEPWTLVLHVALKPDRASTSGPDFLYNDYYEQIAAGAKARLMGMTGKPWSNPTMAVANAGIFDAAIIKANTRQAHGFGRGRVRVRAEFL
jgi:hypothetical protein